VVANGDIDSPLKAREVLARTGADAVMIGRAAQGRPWIFREIVHFLATGETLPAPDADEIRRLLREHLLDHYAFHGAHTGVRTARKHVGWYLAGTPEWAGARETFHRLETPEAQLAALERLHETIAARGAPPSGPQGAANEKIFERRQVA
jgi:tRNA-dihydrouridine synthase B